jgi:O-antigen/teichoic acid export membrane protein
MLRPLFSMVAIALCRILGIAITIILLYKNIGLWAIPIGMLIAEICILIAGLYQTVALFRELRAKILIDRGIIIEYFQVGGVAFMARLGSVLSRESDPLLITLFLRPELTTAYMVTRKAADIVFQMLSVAYGASHSVFSHLVGLEDNGKTVQVATSLLVFVYVSGLVGFVTYIIMNHSFVTLWVGETFALNQDIILAIGLAYFVNSLRNMVWQVLNGFGEYQYSSSIIFMEGVGKMLLAAVLLKFIGILGVPLAFAITSMLSLIALIVRLHNYFRLQVSKREQVGAFAITLLLFTLSWFYANMFQPISWVMFVLLSGGVLLVVSMACALSNWSLFRALIKSYL